MLNTLKLHFLQNKSLFIAVLLSLLLHALFLSEFTLRLPDVSEHQQTLKMRLVKLPPTQKPAPPAIKKKIQKPVPAAEQTSPQETQATDLHDINPIAETPAHQEPIPAEPAKNTPPTIAEPSVSDVAEPSDETALGDTETEPISTPYQYVETRFEVFRGGDTSAAGIARIKFNIDKDGTYQINSTTEAKGLVSLFFQPLVQKSEGMVTESGLKPIFFSYEYGKSKTQSARFAWGDGILLLRTEKGDKTETLIPDTQDLLSFMYQFMFKPPLETMQISITNGKNLRTYAYSFEGEEVISTKLGELKTVHLLKSGDSEEKTELWLGLDYQYLPVKIRKTEKNGSVIEQIVTNIQTELPNVPLD